jgi:hypothetical protein
LGDLRPLFTLAALFLAFCATHKKALLTISLEGYCTMNGDMC